LKITANDYEPQEMIKIIREWTEMTQKEFGRSIHRSARSIGAFEQGTRNYTMVTLLEIARTHGLTITIEKRR